MSVVRLILLEILYRKLSFTLGVLSVLVAVGCLVAALGLLRAHDLHTEEILAVKQAETAERMQKLEDDTAARMQKLEDDYRKMSLNMGFNLQILPRDQNLIDFYADDFASKTMPEDYADRLAKARLATINHLMPSLQQKLVWPEQKRTILVMGVREESFVQSKKQKPILQPVPPGHMVVGYELHQSLGLKVGDKVTLKGKEFTVHKLHPERGSKDDITVWIDLKEAQELLGQPGRINAMLALECNCDKDLLARIRAEVAQVLPDTQVKEFTTQAVMRAEARNRAAVEANEAKARAASEARAALDHERQNRATLRAEKEGLAAVVVPVLVLGCAVWIAFLMLANVRERRGEIGILRALGLKARQVFALFLGKAALMGLLGAGLGYAAGLLVSSLAPDASSALTAVRPDLRLLAVVLAAAPVLAALAGWLPALLAVQQDPAVILREE